ncbi:hypothetical protein FRAHR75_410012 [Frankia sp. Hr75.2]|nr:hypothetical protein FRAHR75_410012 [Frankia sp. Hr75.2]SQD98598.1 hypothetical protein FMEAI12_4800020 [Parafrankia sp. Ea1.12]
MTRPGFVAADLADRSGANILVPYGSFHSPPQLPGADRPTPRGILRQPRITRKRAVMHGRLRRRAMRGRPVSPGSH